jgi:hypothetical protein
LEPIGLAFSDDQLRGMGGYKDMIWLVVCARGGLSTWGRDNSVTNICVYGWYRFGKIRSKMQGIG